MHMHADPFAEDGRRKLHGQNLAAALLEGAFQRMESTLREPGGEIQRSARAGVPNCSHSFLPFCIKHFGILTEKASTDFQVAPLWRNARKEENKLRSFVISVCIESVLALL